MLVLTREVNEVICIGDDVQVMVVGIQGKRVRLGIVAPESIEVDRAEIREAKNASDSSRIQPPTNGSHKEARVQNFAGCAKLSGGGRRRSD